MNKYIYIFIIFFVIVSILIFYFNISKIKLNELDTKGYLILPKMVNQEDCDKVMMTVNMEMIEKKKEEYYILSPKKRKHLALPLDENIKYVVKIISRKIRPVIDNYFKNPTIIECAIFLSYPGCDNQNWHRDSSKKLNNEKLLTIAVSLNDIDKVNGPLQLYEGSHNYPENEYKKLNHSKDKLFDTSRYKQVSATVNRGDIIIWDSNIIHRGSKNNGNFIRPLFYFSLIDKDTEIPDEIAGALKSEYRGKVDLDKIIL